MVRMDVKDFLYVVKRWGARVERQFSVSGRVVTLLTGGGAERQVVMRVMMRV